MAQRAHLRVYRLKMIALNLAVKIAASILSVPPEAISVSLPPMAPPPRSQKEFQHRREIDGALASFWKETDGFDSSLEEQNLVDERYGVAPEATSKRPSTYGEITPLGSRQLFDYMNMYTHQSALNNKKKQDIIFYDLGSGAGRLVAQSFLELPRIRKAIGVEMAASRHESAVSAWGKLVDSGRADDIRRMGVGNTLRNTCANEAAECVQFNEGDLFDLDVSDATHIYASSLCFTEVMMTDLASKLNSEAPRLQCVATLQQFPPKSLFCIEYPAMEFVEMSWTAARGEGCPVYFYFRPTRNKKQ